MQFKQGIHLVKLSKKDPLAQLAIADPDLANAVRVGLKEKRYPVSDQNIAFLVKETLWGLSREISFGKAMAKGYTDLIGEIDQQKIKSYQKLIRRFEKQGPTLGRILTTCLVPVFKHGDEGFLEHFLHTVDIMLSKGTYTLRMPLEFLSHLLVDRDLESATVYLDLLGQTFSQNLSYSKSQHFSYILPRAVSSFSRSKRAWQIEQLVRVIQTDVFLADPLIEGLEKGLYLLSQEALSRFVSLGLEKFKRSRQLGIKFFSLESKLAIDTYTEMQVTIPLSQVQQQLNRYLRARTGQNLTIRPLSSLPKPFRKDPYKNSLVCSDGKFIYLSDEISIFPDKTGNTNLYKCLTRLEAGYYEFGTFEFDLEKVFGRPLLRVKSGIMNTAPNSHVLRSGPVQDLKDEPQNQRSHSDLEHFFLSFPITALASDLFTIFEQGRIRLLLTRSYPGLIRQVLPILHREAARMAQRSKAGQVLFLLYCWVSLGIPGEENLGIGVKRQREMRKIKDLFQERIKTDHSVETCGELVVRTYPVINELLKQTADAEGSEERHRPLQTPFGRRLRPDLFFYTYKDFERVAVNIKVRLAEKGFHVYKSDLKRHLMANNGSISQQALQELILCSEKNSEMSTLQQQGLGIDLSWLDLSALLGTENAVISHGEDFSGPVYWYREWDHNIQDYLQGHVRVLERSIPVNDDSFYYQALRRHSGLVERIRYAFELLKPEGLLRLRQWIEGDEFDYRALLDFVIDQKAGRIPSDRLYIKRIKQTRDVAVLLLVDLSRSTANTVFGSQATILDVEKDAIVLFCEALNVVGDSFAIAGFSGTGRLSVDYFRIKDFDEQLNDVIRQRITAMAPQRSTRMGAAIRHATAQLEKFPSKVRLLIILGDGFPNDTGYKQMYAIEDTCKAIFEARSKNIFAHAITVNLTGDSKLDDLYGKVHHNVISDVSELPDKLLRIYSSLTRN